MGTIYSALVVEWKEDAGPPRTVQLDKVTPYHMHASAEGATLNEHQILLDYLAKQAGAQRNRLFDLYGRGLLNLTIVAESNINPPS